MNITEIRQKYPMYSDLSDQQLVDGLHAKYYSDMPKEEFYSKVGLSSAKPTPAEESDKIGDALLQKGKEAAGAVTGGALGLADFVYGGIKSIPQAVMAAGAVLGGNKASDVEKYMMPEMAEATEKVAPSIGTIAEKLGVPSAFATKSPGYKWMNTEPMTSIGQALQLPGKGVEALGGSKELAAGTNIAAMAGLTVAPMAKGIAPKAPVNPLTVKSGLPFRETETPRNFNPESVSIRAADDLAAQYEAKKAQEQVKAPEEAQGLPKFQEEPLLIPGTEKLSPQGEAPQPSPLPVLPDQLLPLSEQYPKEIPIGRVEGGIFPDTSPLPELPPAERGLLSLAEEQPTTRTVTPEKGIDFPLRQEVLQQPEISQAIDNFRAVAAELEATAANAISPNVRRKAATDLAALQDEFAAGMRELGIGNAGEAHGLNRPLYESGVPTKRGVIHGFSGGVGKKQGGAIDPSVFMEVFPSFKKSTAVDKTGMLVPLFHGGNALEKGLPNRGTGIYGNGLYLTQSPKRASGFSKKYDSTGQVFQLYANLENPISSDTYTERFGLSPKTFEKGRAITEQLKKEGYDGIINRDPYTGEIWEAVVFEPDTKVKSAISGATLPEITVGKDKLLASKYADKLGSSFIGKSQRGAIGTKSELVTPEQIMESYKRQFGKDMPVEDAISLAKERNTQLENASTKIKSNKAVDNLSKKIGSPFTSRETLTPEEAKLLLDSGRIKDIDTNQFTKLVNTGARTMSSTYGQRAYYNNPLVEAVIRPLSRAADAAKYKADHVIWGNDGVGTQLSRLNKAEYTDLANRMIKYEGQNVPLETVLEGLSPAAQQAGKALRRALDEDLKVKNEARIAEGKKPISPRANYLSGSFFGDRVFQVLNDKGEIVGVVTGYSKDLQVARDWISKNHPELSMTPETSNIRATSFKLKGDNLAELYDMILEDNKKGGMNLQEGVLNAIRENRVLASEKVRGAHLHEKHKKDTAVWGAQGFKPWMDRDTNARELFQSQVSQIENSITRSELAKAAKTIEEFEKVIPGTNAVKLAKDKLADMQGQNNYLKAVEDRIKRGLSSSGLGQEFLKGGRKADPMINAAMNTKFFAVNAGNALINTFEVLTKTPAAILHGSVEAPMLARVAAPWGVLKATGHMAELAADGFSGKNLKGDSKLIHDYAMKQNVGNPTVEVAGSVAPSTKAGNAARGTMDVLNATISVPEIAGRYTSFVTTAHSLIAMGVEKGHALDLAHDLVKFYFKDYSKLEAPALFTRLGNIGMSGRQLRTWVFGEIMNYSAALANKQPALLSTLVGLTALVYGADSVPLFKQTDELVNIIRNMAIKFSGDMQTANKFADIATPREWLYKSTGGDVRGVMDQSLEKVGIQGSTAGSTEWRLLPQNLLEVIPKISYLTDAGVSLATAVKEVFKDDPNAGVILKELANPVAPKGVSRYIETKAVTTPEGNVLSTRNNLSPNKAFSNRGERNAYILGMQPKTSAMQRYGEELDFRRSEGIKERRMAAQDKLIEAFNNTKLNPKATARYESAVRNFVKAYSGADMTEQAMRTVIKNAAMEMNLSKAQLAKLETIKNAKNNMELVKFFMEVTGGPQQRKAE